MRTTDKRKVVRSALVLFLALALALLPAVSPIAPYAYASELDEKKDELDETNKDIKQTQNQIKESKAQSQELLNQIQQLETQITQTSGEISVLTQQLNDTKGKVNAALKELAQIEDDIEKKNTALSKRLRMMYMSGESSMLSVLFGATSMADMMNSYEMMQRIFKADTELIKELEQKHEEATVRKNELVDLKNTLEAQKKDLDAKKSAMSKDAKSVANLRSKLQKDTAALEKLIDDLKKEADRLKGEILKLQSSGKYAGGKMCWPAAGSARVTSAFGYRIHPLYGGYKFHTGIDIGAGKGTNILAANSGTVIITVVSTAPTGYGTYVVIDHGGGITTLYAHCLANSIQVKKGQKVARGQVIAKVGTTGASTGYHLHFEVRIKGQYKNPLEYVTPGQFYYD